MVSRISRNLPSKNDRMLDDFHFSRLEGTDRLSAPTLHGEHIDHANRSRITLALNMLKKIKLYGDLDWGDGHRVRLEL